MNHFTRAPTERLPLADDARRAPYARPGGPQATADWAIAQLDALGYGPAARVVQQRTWNLSAVSRADAPHTVAWVKQVPSMFHHEGGLLDWLARNTPLPVPAVLARGEAGRMLLAHVDGDDWYGAGPRERLLVASSWHPAQAATAAAMRALIALRVPDRRGPALGRLITRAVAPWAGAVPGLAALLDTLDARLAALAACGLPDVLVHGDLHPGNVRGAPGHPVVIDWGDAFLGHAAFDILRLGEGLTDRDRPTLEARWCAQWQDALPGCDAARALRLARPLAPLRHAAVYAGFLAAIEAAEHPYHRDDVPAALSAAVATLARHG